MMADPSKGNKLVTTTAHDVATTEARIKHSAAVTTKGKAPTAMTRRTTNIQVHIEQREAIVAAEISHRTLRATKKCDPSPSPPSSPHGDRGGGGGSARSRGSKHDPPQGGYDARSRLNKIAKSQTSFFLSPKCFGTKICDDPIPHGFKIENNIR
jgi:hypothetical protein